MQLLSNTAAKKRIHERQKEGIAIAHQKGTKFRFKKIGIIENFTEDFQVWKTYGINAVEAIQRAGLKSNAFYRKVNEYEASL